MGLRDSKPLSWSSSRGEPTALRRIGGPQAHRGVESGAKAKPQLDRGERRSPADYFSPTSVGALFVSLPGAPQRASASLLPLLSTPGVAIWLL
jgi:hypothetical protein